MSWQKARYHPSEKATLKLQRRHTEAVNNLEAHGHTQFSRPPTSRLKCCPGAGFPYSNFSKRLWAKIATGHNESLLAVTNCDGPRATMKAISESLWRLAPTHLPTYPPTHPPAYLPTYLPAHLPACLPTYPWTKGRWAISVS